MGYWSSVVKRDNIRDLSNHPWADLLKKTLAQVEPETLAELEASGELNDFLTVKVKRCQQEIRSMQASGMDHQEAQEIAISDMLPRAPEAAEDWEEEGALQDLADAFSDIVGGDQDAGSDSDMDDRRD